MIWLGCHTPVPVTTAIGSDPWAPFGSVKRTQTPSLAERAPPFLTKKRIVGEFGVTHIDGLVAELPAGSESAVVSVLGSMPAVLLSAASAAPPVRFQPGAPFSNEPPGVRK